MNIDILVPDSEAKKLSPQQRKVLAFLRYASKPSSMQIIAATGVIRYGARIMELRAKGYDIEANQEGRGLFTYELKESK